MPLGEKYALQKLNSLSSFREIYFWTLLLIYQIEIIILTAKGRQSVTVLLLRIIYQNYQVHAAHSIVHLVQHTRTPTFDYILFIRILRPVAATAILKNLHWRRNRDFKQCDMCSNPIKRGSKPYYYIKVHCHCFQFHLRFFIIPYQKKK